MSNYPHPPQGYYAGGPPPPAPPEYPPFHGHSYDLPPRGPGIPMPPPPSHSRGRSFISRHQSVLWSLVFWVIFLLIDVFANHFPDYPWSASRHRRGRTLIIVIYTFVFQTVWLLGVGLKTGWDVSRELRDWWRRGQRGAVQMLGMLGGSLLILVLVGWPVVALGINASVLAKSNRASGDDD